MFLLKYAIQIKKNATVNKQKAAQFLIITADQRTSWKQREETIFLFKKISKQHLSKCSLQSFRIQWVGNILLKVYSKIKTYK